MHSATVFSLRVINALLIPLLVLSSAFAQESTSARNKLIGVWESPDTTKGGLGVIYEFREDGGLIAGMGALVNLTFDPQDPNLKQLLSDNHPPGNEERPQKIMDGPVGSAPYVGVWKFRHYTGGFAYQQITADGRIMLRVPFPTPWGRYEVKGKKLRMFPKGCPPVDMTFKVTENTLDLTKAGKKTLRLIRVTPTWYHALTESETEEARIRIQQNPKNNEEQKQAPQPDFKIIQ